MDTTTTFDVYVFGTRSAATAAMLKVMGAGGDPAALAMSAAHVGEMDAKRIAGRVCAAAKRAGMPSPSPTILARRIPEIVKGARYGTMPYGDDDRTIVFVRRDGDLPTSRAIRNTAQRRLTAARPALAAAAELAPRQIAA